MITLHGRQRSAVDTMTNVRNVYDIYRFVYSLYNVIRVWPSYMLRIKGEEQQCDCDDTHQNSVEIRPVKKRSDSIERSTWEEEWFRNERPGKY